MEWLGNIAIGLLRLATWAHECSCKTCIAQA